MISTYIITFLQNLPPEAVLCLEYFVCLFTILGMMKLAGMAGLYTYISLAVIIANIQVLKTVNFSFLSFPIALGTIVFSSTFLAVDILTEFYGADKARKAVWLSFMASLLVTLLMIITLGIKPDESSGITQQAMQIIFMPGLSLFFASLISFFICQQIDIWIFQLIRKITAGKYLWLRTSVSLLGSAFLDNVIFSSLAWVVFAKNPVSMNELLYTYIFGTYMFRIIITLLQTPIIYLISGIGIRRSRV